MTEVEERPEPKATPLALAAAVVGAVAIAAVFFLGAATTPLAEPDEPRYAEIGREILVRGDWVTPTLSFVKYFEKPPLVYWATAGALAAFGLNELAARLPAVLSALAAIALTVWLAARMFGQTCALLVLPIVALGPLFGVMAETISLDMPLTACLTLAMAAVWMGASGSTPRASGGEAEQCARGWYRLAYVATALAVLVKGPVAVVLVGGAAGLFLVLHGGWRALRPVFDWRGLVLAAVIALPWYVLVSWRNPEFLHYFVVDQHIARYLWTTEHGQPIWFFVPVLLLALGPWGLILLFDPPLVRVALTPASWTPPTRFLVIWAAVIVVFFSLSTSKLITYVLPAMPPLAILTARAIQSGWAAGRTAGLARVAWFFMVAGLVLGVCAAVLPHVVEHWRMAVLSPFFYAGGAVVLVTGWLTWRERQAGRPYVALAVLSFGWLGVMTVTSVGRVAANQYRSLGLAARAAMGPDDRIVMYRNFTQGISFYTERRPIMVGYRGELGFGIDQLGEAERSTYFWPGDDELRREWAGPGRLFMVINRQGLSRFAPPLEPAPIIVAEKDKKVLVVNR